MECFRDTNTFGRRVYDINDGIRHGRKLRQNTQGATILCSFPRPSYNIWFFLFHSTLDQSQLVDEFVMRNEQRQARFALGVTRH